MDRVWNTCVLNLINFNRNKFVNTQVRIHIRARNTRHIIHTRRIHVEEKKERERIYTRANNNQYSSRFALQFASFRTRVTSQARDTRRRRRRRRRKSVGADLRDDAGTHSDAPGRAGVGGGRGAPSGVRIERVYRSVLYIHTRT